MHKHRLFARPSTVALAALSLAAAAGAQELVVPIGHTGPLSGANAFAGYEVAVFPDALDAGPNIEIGYLPGAMRWLVAERLAEAGLTVVNDDMTGLVHRDRNLLTGDSPLASNALGRLAVGALTGTDYAER